MPGWVGRAFEGGSADRGAALPVHHEEPVTPGVGAEDLLKPANPFGRDCSRDEEFSQAVPGRKPPQLGEPLRLLD